jgi:hypothetical protein
MRQLTDSQSVSQLLVERIAETPQSRGVPACQPAYFWVGFLVGTTTEFLVHDNILDTIRSLPDRLAL